VSGYAALRLLSLDILSLEPNHLFSHSILKIIYSKNLAHLEPRYGIEP
jgi:hypothetical protein